MDAWPVINTTPADFDKGKGSLGLPYSATADWQLPGIRHAVVKPKVYFACLNLLQIPGRNLRPFRQFFLRQAPAQAFTAHALAERPYPRPLFFPKRQPILSPTRLELVNDTHIVKCAPSPPPPSRT